MSLRTFIGRFTRSPEIRNIYHPEVFPHIRKAFIGPGVHGKKTQYWTWKGDDLLDETIGRWHAADRHIIEFGMRINSEDLLKYINIVLGYLTPNQKGEIEIGKAQVKLEEIKERTRFLATKDTLLRLASVVYVDDTELVDGYDYKKGNEKIKLWREQNTYDFFFIKPMRKFLPLDGYSKATFLDYIEQVEKEIHESHSLMVKS